MTFQMVLLPLSLKYLDHIKLREKFKKARGVKRGILSAMMPVKAVILNLVSVGAAVEWESE